MKNILVSILISNYNKEIFLKKCIKSCLKQKYKNTEIIIVDNKSTDGSVKLIKKFKKIKFYQVKNRTKYPALNQIRVLEKAFRYSRGKIICLLDSDDFFKLNKVKTIVDFFSKNKKTNIICDTPMIYHNQNDFFPFKLKKNILIIQFGHKLYLLAR